MKKKFSIAITLIMVALLTQFIPVKCFAEIQVANLLEKDDAKNSSDIVDIAISDGRFKTLVDALKSADLVNTLKGNGPFTVFAPIDDAFAKLPANTISDLLKAENKKNLVNILTYHVTPGKILAADLIKLDGKEITMVNGAKAKIEVKNNEVFIDGAKVIVKDIIAKNGVIHVIDTVMMP
ncbi:fasciclin domain-containing protein [Clostridium gasigenes]|uniref:fasciclin domain-containing protein n=1 Tax=Clostridium gasigenes TaxID=94869 RepID=UPI001C0DF86A|nr:fasciclin domain-containing protein [Clostridium gasigenes]MBU3132682.1 fasciclin domain-containing protein [Clostridium gasigenes]